MDNIFHFIFNCQNYVEQRLFTFQNVTNLYKQIGIDFSLYLDKDKLKLLLYPLQDQISCVYNDIETFKFLINLRLDIIE